MTFKESMAKFLSTSQGTYYKWKKEKRPFIQFIDKYLSKEELEEFLNTGEVKRLERLKELEEIEKNYNKIMSLCNEINNINS